jgi:GH15 family glucan-1,4-alpha-glucosidase
MAIVSRDPVAERSLRVLHDGQARSGAFVASPAFRVYDFGWLRDGAFCAYALDRVGEQAAAAAFHRWVLDTLERHRQVAEAAIGRLGKGEVPPFDAMLPARFTLDGKLEEPDRDDPWPNFQVDGYGLWLWALEDHLAGRPLEAAERRTVELAARYIAATWRLKCCSCWEEFQGGEHASTIAAAASGLASAARVLEDDALQKQAEAAREHLVSRFSVDGRLGRGPDDPRVDGSMIWVSVPLSVLPADDPRAANTIAAIKRDLVGPGGGVYRYLGDSYFGGGEWLLLASSLAWHEAVAGDGDDASELSAWVRAQASADRDLPEQVTTHAQDPAMVQPWIDRWGAVANPLLWSHAMYLIVEAVRG